MLYAWRIDHSEYNQYTFENKIKNVQITITLLELHYLCLLKHKFHEDCVIFRVVLR
jgi:hypothetical protein